MHVEMERAMVASRRQWAPDSWSGHSALQQPEYPNLPVLQRALAELSNLPPLVTSWEVVALKEQLARAAAGQCFVLQGGDCAERFADCSSQRIANQLKILIQMSLVLVQGARKPVVRIGRFAGQYAKPRSADYEDVQGVRLPSYRGDLINRPEPTLEARTPDPNLLLRGYERAALTLNFIRALVKGGFADLHHPEYWDLDWTKHSPQAEEYHNLLRSITDSLRFMENILGAPAGGSDRIDFYTSHEALHLGYEQAQTRQVPHRTGWYNLSTHFPWIGIRTIAPDGAHVEYMRGIDNPIGMKVGQATPPDMLLKLMDILDPDREPGRLTLIHRFGAEKIAAGLPPLVEAVTAAGRRVLWICDPMHGNTKSTSSGYKTRDFGEIESELSQAFDIHARLGSHLGGVHIELTGENVTECTGGARGLNEHDLHRAYETEVDPRLNYEQSLELALLVANKLRAESR
ncbi:3-deoxy-7-phosphoheptulonate synthase class II [Paludibaculum fermentans]|uniref:Phospho-2-dehydro-3-deoxyheptonate aldolase n=2 Tax=Paludibaculum fermentans TaxID=1473598 RepID=A0A7S7NTQ1_PALFE|nr:3-deoxy-7-phosphoheptulonate synthase class II [Paludibaculum fermentans]